jgi:hypothetical protein
VKPLIRILLLCMNKLNQRIIISPFLIMNKRSRFLIKLLIILIFGFPIFYEGITKLRLLKSFGLEQKQNFPNLVLTWPHALKLDLRKKFPISIQGLAKQ